MMSSILRKPLNLTEVAERAQWFGTESHTQVLSSEDSTSFKIDVVNVAEAGHQSQGLNDEACVVIFGCGVLRYGTEMIQCTAGDLLFIPAGVAYCFERLDGAFRIWWIHAHTQR